MRLFRNDLRATLRAAPTRPPKAARAPFNAKATARRLFSAQTTMLLLLVPLLLLPAPPARAQEAAAAPADSVAGAKDDAPKPSSATGSITGRVVADGGQPLAHAVVFARRFGPGVRAPGVVAAGEDGRFRLDDLEAGVYQLNANAPGYVLDPVAAAARSGANFHRLGDSVTLRLIKGGVVTGTVTDADGDPVVAAFVRAVSVRAADGSPPGNPPWSPPREHMTDDRGVYRIYGLAPGVYVVYSSGNSPNYYGLGSGGNEGDAPTYHPSATRDAATEINVRAGEEVGGVDIRHRGERGHSVSGTVAGVPAQAGFNQGGVFVTLVHAATGTTFAGAWVSGREGERSFTVSGVGDGDYELQAQRQTRSGEAMLAPSLRVSVRGADVTGLQLSLAALSSVRGTVRLEPLAEPALAAGQCAATGLLPQEVAVTARREDEKDAAEPARPRPFRRAESAPDEAGDFTLTNLEAGRYRVEARPLDPDWYLRALEIRASPSSPSTKRGAPSRPATQPAQAARAAPLEALDLKAGQQLNGLRLFVAQGAAALSGRVAAAEAGAPAHGGARLHLVPAERERAEAPLRYAEAPVQADGAFAFSGLAPGRYRLLLRPAPLGAATTTAERPAAYDTAARARLRREAEAAGVPVELQPCQRLNDFKLRPTPATGKQ